MRDKLMLLEDLQELDLKADGTQSRIQDALSEIESLDSRLQEARDAIEAKRQELSALDEERKTLEENLATENANIARSEANLKGITTQKEYQAVNKEIASAKKLIGELEEQILQKSARGEELKGELSAMESDTDALEENITRQKGEVQARIDAEEATAAADVKVRDDLVKSIPAGLLKRYAKLREARRGVAVVEARDGGCLGCNMHIPPQMYNNLFRGEELITCPHCQRILVLHLESQE
ncbi:MAG TPA: C4-type zinc ribbon domain-containing protein [Geobacteraceae bacterium]|nr:C4-type zinc ribbon domain-containing protein [Geobacteraceae bacterium]